MNALLLGLPGVGAVPSVPYSAKVVVCFVTAMGLILLGEHAVAALRRRTAQRQRLN